MSIQVGEQDKEERSRSRKVCILNVPDKQNICCRSRNIFLHAGAFTSQLREGLVLGFCVREALRGWPNSLDNKNQRCNCRWKKRKTYVLVSNSYSGYVDIVAAVQEFEVNLWMKDKFEWTKHNMRRTYRWSLDRGKKCECEEKDEAGVEMHFRRVER